MSDSLLNNPKHWRDRAEETLTLADQTYGEESKNRLLRIAREYEAIAERAEQNLRDKAASIASK